MSDAEKPLDLLRTAAIALRESAAVHMAERIPHLTGALLALADALDAYVPPGPPPGPCGELPDALARALHDAAAYAREAKAAELRIQAVREHLDSVEAATPGDEQPWTFTAEIRERLNASPAGEASADSGRGPAVTG